MEKKKQMSVKANKPNAKSTVAKRKTNALIVEDRESFCMRDPSPRGPGGGARNTCSGFI